MNKYHTIFALGMLLFIFLLLVGCNSPTKPPVVTSPSPVPTTSEPVPPTVTPTPSPTITSVPLPVAEYPVSVVVHPAGSGMVETSPDDNVVPEGIEMELTITAEEGFELDYLTINGVQSDNQNQVIIESDTDIDVYFVFIDDKILPENAWGLVEKGIDLILVDVRPLADYEEDHIPEAISIPYDEIGDRWQEVDHDKIVLVYASCLK